MWYFIVFLLANQVQFGPFATKDQCNEVLTAVFTYPHRTAEGWTAIGCWEVKP